MVKRKTRRRLKGYLNRRTRLRRKSNYSKKRKRRRRKTRKQRGGAAAGPDVRIEKIVNFVSNVPPPPGYKGVVMKYDGELALCHTLNIIVNLIIKMCEQRMGRIDQTTQKDKTQILEHLGELHGIFIMNHELIGMPEPNEGVSRMLATIRQYPQTNPESYGLRQVPGLADETVAYIDTRTRIIDRIIMRCSNNGTARSGPITQERLDALKQLVNQILGPDTWDTIYSL